MPHVVVNKEPTHDLDRLTSRLGKVQNSESLFKSLCKLVPNLERKATSSSWRRVVATVANKYKESLSILSKYVSSTSMYKPNSVRERGHPCVISMSNIVFA